jgi:hypothetical protein
MKCTKCGVLDAMIRPAKIVKFKGAVLCPNCREEAKKLTGK